MKKYEEQVQFLRQQLHNLEDKMESEREALTKKFQDDRAGLEEELACAIREELKVRSKDQRSWQKIGVVCPSSSYSDFSNLL